MILADRPTSSSRRRHPSAVATRVAPVTHGLLALIRPSSGHVCHSLIVLSYCTPGSADAHAAYAISFHISAAGRRLETAPSVRRLSSHSPFFASVSKKRLDTRTLLLEFCPATVRYASLSQSVSYSGK